MNYKEYKEIKKNYKKTVLKSCEWLKGENWKTVKSSWIYREKLTTKQKEKPEKEQKKLLIEKEKREAQKKIELFNKKCDQIASAQECKYLYINVNWVKNATWGYNPHAEIRTREYHTGSASGCGYDKLTTAIAQALNEDITILKRLYNKYEEALRKGKSTREFVGYGSGYTTPYFEGGVGYSSFKTIFDNLGAKVNTWREGKNWDSMIIEF